MRARGILLAAGLLLISSCTYSRPYARAWIIGPDDEILQSKTITPWEHKTRKLLNEKKISFFFQEIPLSEVLKHISEETGLTFVVGNSENGDADTPVTLRVKDMVLRNALDWIATLAGTKWGVHNRAILFDSQIKPPFGDGRPHVPLEVWKARVEEAIQKDSLGDKRISFHFQETRLSKVMAFISDLIGVTVVPHPIKPDPPVTLRVNRMAVRNAVDWVLALTISDNPFDHARQAVKYYSLETIDLPLEQDLLEEVVRPVDDSPTFEWTGDILTVTANEDAHKQIERLFAELKRASPRPAMPIRVYNLKDITEDARQTLLDSAKRIGEDTWTEEGALLRIEKGFLIVRCTREMHGKIEKLLAQGK